MTTTAKSQSQRRPQSGRLNHLGVLRFTGPDAQSFLQGQISNDSRRLAEGQSLLAAYSSPQGRVLAVMLLLPHSSGVLAVMPRELVMPTLQALHRFVLRAKVTLEDASERLLVSGQHDAERLQSAGVALPTSHNAYIEQDGVGVAAVSSVAAVVGVAAAIVGGAQRYWVIGAADKLAAHGLAGDVPADGPAAAQIEHDWRLADIRAGLPQIYLATREAFVAQMLNLDLLDGISFNKGCYTGQEIIARTQHLGRIKRRMFRLALPPGTWTVGQSLRLTDGRSGRLTEVVQTNDGFEALAVLNTHVAVEGDNPDVAGDAVTATELPIPYS